MIDTDTLMTLSWHLRGLVDMDTLRRLSPSEIQTLMHLIDERSAK